MKNITVSVDDDTHQIVQIRTAQMGTSVSALLREYLSSLAREESDESNIGPGLELRPSDSDEVIADFDSRGSGLHPEDNLTRDELYDESDKRP